MRCLLSVIGLLACWALVFAQQQPSPSAMPSAAEMRALVVEAQAKANAREWKEAGALLERLVKLNPVQPDYWYSLGMARYRAKDYQGAIPALEKAAELGAPLMGAYYSVYNVACCHALAGDKEKALATLERALALGFPSLSQPAKDDDLASLRDDPRFKKMLGLADVSKMSRDEGWRYDLSIL